MGAPWRNSTSPGGPVDRMVPPGDNRERLVCGDCGFILYDNPKIVVGSVVRLGPRYLLCKRAIEPRLGFWTLPAGYMELNETTEAGAPARSLGRGPGAHPHRRAARGLQHPAAQPGPADLPRRADRPGDRARSGKPGGRPVPVGRDPLVRPRLPLGPMVPSKPTASSAPQPISPPSPIPPKPTPSPAAGFRTVGGRMRAGWPCETQRAQRTPWRRDSPLLA